MATESLETTRGIIPQEVWSFYDPNGSLTPSDNPEGALLSWLDSKREQSLILPHIGRIATRRLVAMELTHIGAITSENALLHADWLDQPTGTIEQGVEAAALYAQDISHLCRQAITRVRRDTCLDQASDIVLAGAILSANTHLGEKRLSGRSYYSHPRAVGLLLQTAAQIHLNDLEQEQIETFDGLLHDGFEHAIDKRGGSFLATPRLLVSPLVIATVLQDLGVSGHVAWNAARDNLTLTKLVGPDGGIAWDTYIHRFDLQPTANPKKLAGLRHNRDIDPKIAPIEDPQAAQKIASLRNQYRDAQNYLSSVNKRLPHVQWSIGQELFALAINNLDVSNLRDAEKQSAWAHIPEDKLIDSFKKQL